MHGAHNLIIDENLNLSNRFSILKCSLQKDLLVTVHNSEFLSIVHLAAWQAVLEGGLLAGKFSGTVILSYQHFIVLESALEEVAICEIKSALE